MCACVYVCILCVCVTCHAKQDVRPRHSVHGMLAVAFELVLEGKSERLEPFGACTTAAQATITKKVDANCKRRTRRLGCLRQAGVNVRVPV